MKLYIVRHGESEGNAAKVHQRPETLLSGNGKKQAEFAGKRFLNIEINKIIASPFARAKETAEIIGSVIKKPIEINPVLAEIKRPSEILDKTEEETFKLREWIRENWANPRFRHSDEETFFELRERAIIALKQLSSSQEENVLLVSHGIFITMLLAIMIYDENVMPHQYIPILKFFHMKNTGITLCEFKDDKWKLHTWNDHAHLG